MKSDSILLLILQWENHDSLTCTVTSIGQPEPPPPPFMHCITMPVIPIMSLDVWLCNSKPSYLNSNRFRFYDISYLFFWTSLMKLMSAKYGSPLGPMWFDLCSWSTLSDTIPKTSVIPALSDILYWNYFCKLVYNEFQTCLSNIPLVFIFL